MPNGIFKTPIPFLYFIMHYWVNKGKKANFRLGLYFPKPSSNEHDRIDSWSIRPNFINVWVYQVIVSCSNRFEMQASKCESHSHSQTVSATDSGHTHKWQSTHSLTVTHTHWHSHRNILLSFRFFCYNLTKTCRCNKGNLTFSRQ